MLKKIIVLSIALLQFCQIGFSFSDSTLNDIEQSKYGTMYLEEDLASRLKRLETDFFGMSQSGNIDERINNLSRIAANNTYIQKVQPYQDFYMPEKKSAVRKFFDNVASSFSAPAMTGYTPSIYGSNIYPNNIYGREYMNFLNNGSNYCPFHNSYYQNPHQRFYNQRYNNRYNHSNNWRSMPPQRIFNSNRYNPHMRQPYYNNIPTDAITNVATRSTVHILRD